MKTYLIFMQFAQRDYSIMPIPPLEVGYVGLLWVEFKTNAIRNTNLLISGL